MDTIKKKYTIKIKDHFQDCFNSVAFWLQLMAASNFFMLDGLQRHCERLCSNKLTFENCIPIYRHAKVNIDFLKRKIILNKTIFL